MEYDISQMPPIDAVELLILTGHKDVAWMQKHLDAPCVRVEGETAQSLAWLWRNLPFSEQMRCHFPPYGFRFYHQNILVLAASVCWECHNIWLEINGAPFLYEFDAQHVYAQELLMMAEILTTSLRHDPNHHSLERNI